MIKASAWDNRHCLSLLRCSVNREWKARAVYHSRPFQGYAAQSEKRGFPPGEIVRVRRQTQPAVIVGAEVVC
jgi:hypothetical protein